MSDNESELLKDILSKDKDTTIYKSDIGIPISDLLSSDIMEILFGTVPYDNKIGYCELTREMDEYLLSNLLPRCKTYIYDFMLRKEHHKTDVEGYIYLIRYPGCTCGCIYTDKDNRIESIQVYEDMFDYRDKSYNEKTTDRIAIDTIKSTYIGKQIIVKYKDK